MFGRNSLIASMITVWLGVGLTGCGLVMKSRRSAPGTDFIGQLIAFHADSPSPATGSDENQGASADHAGGSDEETDHFMAQLKMGDGQSTQFVPVAISEEDFEAKVLPHEEVHIRGRMDNGIIYPDTIEVTRGRSVVAQRGVIAALPAYSGQVFGPQPVLAMKLVYQNTSPPCTEQAINDLIFGTVNAYFQENSLHKISLTGRTVELHINKTYSGCAPNDAYNDALQAAHALGIDTSQYRYQVILMPSGCPFAGLGSIGYGAGGGTSSIMGSYCSNPSDIAHELGHNMGVNHASQGTAEYGDTSDVMGGNWSLAHFNGPHKAGLGWIDGNNILSVQQPGMVTLTAEELPIANGAGIQLLRLANPNPGGSHFVSYRTNFGHDAVLGANFIGFLSVHLWPESNDIETHLEGTTTFFSNGTLSVYELDKNQQTATVYIDRGNEKAVSFITRLYNDYLSRAPDSDGLATWLQNLRSGYARTTIAMGFITSARGRAMNPVVSLTNDTARAQFVNDTYHRFLNRAAHAGELDHWVSYLRTQVTDGFVAAVLGSAEYFMGPSDSGSGGGSGGGENPAAPTAPGNLQVSPVSGTSLSLTWTDHSSIETGFEIEEATAATGPFTQVAALPANTTVYTRMELVSGHTYYYRVRATGPSGNSEYSAVASGTTSALTAAERFVTHLYQDILNRQPDPGGLHGWSDRVTAGASRANIAMAFVTSPEKLALGDTPAMPTTDDGRRQLVQSFYLKYLHRAGEPSGVAAHAAALASGQSIHQLIVTFTSSDEYFARTD